MKKFLSKKPVMISFIVAAVLFLAVYIGMLVRPVSYGFNYTQSHTEEIAGKQVTEIVKVNFKSDKVARQTMIIEVDDKEESKMVGDVWIYRDGDKILMVGSKEMIKNSELTSAELEEYNKSEVMTKAEYEVEVERLEKMKKEAPAAYELTMKRALEVGLFSAGEDIDETKDIDESYTNTQAIVFTVVHGVVTVALVTFATLSLIFFMKRKKA